MDQQRFLDIAYNLRRLTLISSTLLVAFTHLGDKLSGHTKLRVSQPMKELVLLCLSMGSASDNLKLKYLFVHSVSVSRN